MNEEEDYENKNNLQCLVILFRSNFLGKEEITKYTKYNRLVEVIE